MSWGARQISQILDRLSPGLGTLIAAKLIYKCLANTRIVRGLFAEMSAVYGDFERKYVGGHKTWLYTKSSPSSLIRPGLPRRLL